MAIKVKDPIRVAAGKKAAETRRRNQRAYDLGVKRIGREMEAAQKAGNLERLEELENIQMGGRSAIIEDYRAYRSDASRRGHVFRGIKRDIKEFSESLKKFSEGESKEVRIKEGWTREEASRALGEMGAKEFFKLISKYYEEILAAEVSALREEFSRNTPASKGKRKGMLEAFAENNPYTGLK